MPSISHVYMHLSPTVDCIDKLFCLRNPNYWIILVNFFANWVVLKINVATFQKNDLEMSEWMGVVVGDATNSTIGYS